MTWIMRVAAALAVVVAPALAVEPTCRSFADIYPSGKELCNNMFGSSFVYTEDEERAYTMWFFDKENPNDKVTEKLVGEGKFQSPVPVQECHLAYYHKDASEFVGNEQHPAEEPANFQECHPWSERSCCRSDTVSTAKKIKESYGPQWHWDRCGPLSMACERFFVQEACLYECDPNAGIFRKFPKSAIAPNPSNYTVYDKECDEYSGEYNPKKDCEKHNAWEMKGMPIKASYCNAWHRACKADLFCASNGGDFFSCAAEYKSADKQAMTTVIVEDTGLGPSYTLLIILIVLVFVCVISALIYKEKKGNPVFAPLTQNLNGDSAELQGLSRNVPNA